MQFMKMRLAGPSMLMAVGLGFANACGVAHAIPQMPKVRYEVNGPALAQFIYYQTDTGQLHQVNASLPWSTEFTGFGGQVFALSAQGPGPISCKIFVDGNLVSAATATTGTPARTVCTH
ncbi:hypothetical protein AWC25_19590 [Mycobacterium sherrisii]|uniref:Transmembrane protein, MmpS5_2 n=2 Tax=Mycobacterium sherrisii TaxID=243061 RepID=A0A1E3SFS7_9MYCO|nr:hypothetical protein BHQ21_23870 [Mycobacterium sherrisii]ORW71921.1 hypothetical protein AWC25_19590 [Mycobacterium sherrisii]